MELPSSKIYAKAPPKARRLRRLETEAEKALWRLLRARQLDGFKFRRQVPIGHYVADFLCLERKPIVEVDGGKHAAAIEADDARTAYFAKLGFRVIRFWNNEVLQNMDGVLLRIVGELGKPKATSEK